MNDAVSLLEASCKKLTAKVEKLRAQLAAAETELAENQTAIRVLSRLPSAASGNGHAEEGKASSQDLVLNILPRTEEEANTPMEVLAALQKAGVTISADNVRTILSRLKKAETIRVSGGRYWHPAQDVEDDFDILGFPSNAAPQAFDDDDFEVPF